MNTFLITLLAFLLSCVISLIFIAIGLIKEEKFEKNFVKINLVCTFLAMIFGLILDIKSYRSEYVHTKTSTEHIVALNDNPGITGTYYMKRGYIESTLYYNYMVKLSDSYIANHIPANKTYVYEAYGDYRVEWWEKTKGYGLLKQTEKYWKIYIPKNSILSEYKYNIDLQ